jgi:cupin 2 domain-containing protein
MTIEVRNIFALVPPAAHQEQLTALLAATNMRLERIVSHAHASPEGFWYDQEWAE